MNSPIADANERLQALDIHSSYCVQAPAGSGKTELLTQRILKLLAHCERPEEVLAFTFTRKAAAEMRRRLLQNLVKADALKSGGTDNTDEIKALPPHEKLTFELASEVLKQNKAKNWHLLENTQRLRINTIDSFNAYITSQLPIISQFGSQPEVSTDMEGIFQTAVQETLSFLEGDSELAQHIATLLEHLNNNLHAVQKLLCQLLYKRDQWLNHVLTIRDNPEFFAEELNNNLSELVADYLFEAESILAPYGHDIGALLSFAGENLAAKEDFSLQVHNFTKSLPEADPSEREKWIALAHFFLTTKGELRKTVNIKNGFPKEGDGKDSQEKALFKEQKALFLDLLGRFREMPEIEALLNDLTRLPTTSYHWEQWKILSALTAILPNLVAQLTVILRQKGQVDYVQISSAALEALGTEEHPTDLSLHLDYQIKHILIDEFQDTSSLQSSLLEKLTWGWETDDGRTLFIVGDGMQSCYGFRNANVGLFLAARDNGIGSVKLKSLQLQVNFRSESAVVAWVNSIFSQAFPPHDDISRGAVSYSPSVALHSSSPESGVETLLWLNAEDSELSAQAIQKIEAVHLVKQCQALIQSNPDSSVAILVRGRSHLREIVPALRQASVQWNASDIDTLTSYTEITDLLSLLKSLTNLADKTALLALLRAPFIGLSLKDIHQLAHNASINSISLWQSLCAFEAIEALSDDALARLKRTVPVLQKARAARQLSPLRDWLEGIWISLGGPATVSLDNDIAYINTFFSTLEKETPQGEIIDIHQFEKKLNAIYVSAANQSNIKLHIMTIHNAKGLEFDYVFVPSLQRKSPANDKGLLIWKEHLNSLGENKLLLGLLSKQGQADDPTYLYLRAEDDRRTKMENTRLLYIAVTRAAKKVFLSGVVNQKKEAITAPNSSSLLSTIWPQLDPQDASEDENPVDFRALTLSTDENLQNNDPDKLNQIISSRLISRWENPLSVLAETKTEALPMDAEKNKAIEKVHHNLLEKKVGDIVHHCLKLKVEQNLDFSSEELLVELSKQWHGLLKPVCESDAQVKEAFELIKRNLASCIEHPLSAWIFNHSHQESACELALSDYRSSYRKEFVVDRTFVDEENVRWIIDYKSSQLSEGQSIESFEIEQVQNYQRQLQTYAQLFEVLENRTIKTALFFTALPHWIETSI